MRSLQLLMLNVESGEGGGVGMGRIAPIGVMMAFVTNGASTLFMFF